MGTASAHFTGIFEGNGYTIRNLAIHRQSSLRVGLFGAVRSGHIRNTHLVNILSFGSQDVGALVGELNGFIYSSSSNGIVFAHDRVGGLAGHVLQGEIFSSYSQARVSAINSEAGGVVARLNGSNIRASYATGGVNGGIDIGAFIGSSNNSVSELVLASYSGGNTSALANTGRFFGTASVNDPVAFNRSFGFGTILSGFPTNSVDGTSLPTVADGNGGTRPITIAEFTLERANGANSSVWNSAEHFSLNAWDFENRAANGGPSLRYADYDGPTVTSGDGTVTSGGRFHCANDAANAPAGAILIARCGEHLPHQFTSN